MGAKNTEVSARCDELQSQFDGLNGREQEHIDQLKVGLQMNKEALGNLELHHQETREEFLAHVEYQKTEGEKLKHHTTQRYFEQMDKALLLHQSLEKMELGHKELNDTVRGIKLPKV